MNRVIANADLMLPHPKVKPRDSAVVLNLQQQISDEMEQERPSEERIATLLCEIAGQLYKETSAKTQIAAQIAILYINICVFNVKKWLEINYFT